MSGWFPKGHCWKEIQNDCTLNAWETWANPARRFKTGNCRCGWHWFDRCWTISLARYDEEEATVDAVPVNRPEPAVRTVAKSSHSAELSELRPSQDQRIDARETADTAPEALEMAPASISEADQSEMIRKTMSELGKRSAAARAKKKSLGDKPG